MQETTKTRQPVSKLRVVSVVFILLVVFVIPFFGIFAPIPHLQELPNFADTAILWAGLGSACLWLAYIWFTKPGHAWLLSQSEKNTKKQLLLFIVSPILTGAFAAFVMFIFLQLWASLYVVGWGSEQAIDGTVTSMEIETTIRKRCEYKIFIAWESLKTKSHHCISEAMFVQIKQGDKVRRSQWQYGALNAPSSFIWPTKDLPSGVVRAETEHHFRGLVFIAAPFLIMLTIYIVQKGWFAIITVSALWVWILGVLFK